MWYAMFLGSNECYHNYVNLFIIRRKLRKATISKQKLTNTYRIWSRLYIANIYVYYPFDFLGNLFCFTCIYYFIIQAWFRLVSYDIPNCSDKWLDSTQSRNEATHQAEAVWC